jgi:hypothetical protein
MDLAQVLVWVACTFPTMGPHPLECANRSIRIEAAGPSGGTSLEQLLDLVASVTGQPVIWAPYLAERIQRTPVRLNHAIEVPRDRFLSFARGLLRVQELILLPWGPEGAEHWVVDTLSIGLLVRETERFIPLDRLSDYRDRYELVSVTVPFRNLTVNEVMSSANQLVGSYRPGAKIVPSPVSNAIIFTDLGPALVSTVEVLQALDAKARKK